MGQAGVPPTVKLQRDSVLLTVGTFINEGIDIEDVVHIYNGILKMNEVMSFAATDGEGNGPHSSTLAWKIPWMEEPGRLQSMGLLRVGHD